MTSVSWTERSSARESTTTARWTTVSMRSWRTSLPMTERRVSAWTKSISSSALIGSATSQPNSDSTLDASRRATSAPSGLETPVTSTRLGVIDSRLWVYASDRRRVGHALHGQRVGGGAHVDALVHRRVQDLVERARDHVVQLAVHLVLLPEEGLEVLDPLEVGHDHAAGVGDDVRHEEDAPVVQDRIRLGRDRGVRALGDQPRPDATRVLDVDDVLHRGRHEHGDGQLEELGVGDRVAFLEAGDGAAHLAVLLERREVESLRVVHAAPGVADRDDAQPRLGEEPRRRPADLAVA